jgi:UTP--glucose-1-phosphate uridylyltransferase
MKKVKKALIPIAGLGTRFLPLSKVLPKELWPLADKPILQYIIEELKNSGIKEIVFIDRKDKKAIGDYFSDKNNQALEKILKAKKKYDLLKELKNLERITNSISFSRAYQERPLGDGHAILSGGKSMGKEPFAVSFADDVVESKTPCLLQLIKVFEKFGKPVIALCKVPKEEFKSYGMVRVEKIENRVYRIKGIVEKPKTIGQSPSNLAIVGKYVFTPQVLKWLKESSLNKNKELLTAEVLDRKIKEGEEVYGCEFEGKWLECGNKSAYLKSNFYLSLKHPQFGKELKSFLKKI